jgi:SAM-dependent methyltransferase
MRAGISTPIRCPILVGRSESFRALRRLLDATRRGHGQLALIPGAAGVGKSRLVAEIAADAANTGFLVLQGSCFEQDRSSPYAPLLDLLRAQFVPRIPLGAADLDPATRELFRLLPGIAPPPDLVADNTIDPETHKQRLIAALGDHFASLADSQPLLLVFEDLPWSDDGSLEQLLHLARSSAARQICLLVTYCGDEAGSALRQGLAPRGANGLLCLIARGSLTKSSSAVYPPRRWGSYCLRNQCSSKRYRSWRRERGCTNATCANDSVAWPALATSRTTRRRTGLRCYPHMRLPLPTAAGVSDCVRFEQRDVAAGLPASYDVITTFDVVHDAANPVGLLEAVRRALKPDGIHVCVDINCSDKFEENLGPKGAFFHGCSVLLCMAMSLAEHGEGLGTLGLHEGKLRELCAQLGLGAVRSVPIANPFNNLYEMRTSVSGI